MAASVISRSARVAPCLPEEGFALLLWILLIASGHAELAVFDYVRIDSPSGINARSENVFDVSQLILIFYRWLTQHVEGTEVTMGYLNRCIKADQLGGYTYEIVGNAVPRDEGPQTRGLRG
jgi:hypothetical protein